VLQEPRDAVDGARERAPAGPAGVPASGSLLIQPRGAAAQPVIALVVQRT
jgi:hypothetical protein